MNFQVGDTITSGGVVFTYNGRAWTYQHNDFPSSVSTRITVVGTPIPDVIHAPQINDQVEYDFKVLSGLAVGSLYANTVQAG